VITEPLQCPRLWIEMKSLGEFHHKVNFGERPH
jgi:hypothetical protein